MIRRIKTNIIDIVFIKEYIKNEKLTQKEFCKKCKISTSTLYRLLHGNDFSFYMLYKIAKGINIPLNILLL